MKKYIIGLLCLVCSAIGLEAANHLTAQAAQDSLASIVKEWKAAKKKQYQKAWDQRVINIDGLTMPFWTTYYGEEPAGGYNLYISLHGGGTVPAEVNDQQFDNQKYLYEPANSLYFVPRAPYNAWNMWCKPKLDQFYEAIIQMCMAQANINPDRVYLMGFSAGGDGVWRMAPRMADSWAAASMMAGHPGDVSLLNLRNTPFMIWCGAEDAAYDRNKLDKQRGEQMDSLQKADTGGYIHETHIVEGKGHWMDRVDTAAVSWMARYTRNPYPRKIVWQQADVRRPSFYWITISNKEMLPGKTVRLEVHDNIIDISQCDYRRLTFGLNDELVDLNRKVIVRFKGKTIFKGKLRRSAQTLRKTLYERNDPRYAFPAELTVHIDR